MATSTKRSAFKQWILSTTSIRRIDFLIGYGAFVLVCILGFNAVQSGADRALKIAVSANRKATSTEEFISSLKKEKVCSETNQGQACRDLFDRLSGNISEAQRLKFTCVTLKVQGETETMKRINCPVIPPAKVKR